MSAAHTPGPWTLDPEHYAHVIDETYHAITAGVGYLPESGDAIGFGLAGHMTEADARLIAAAPELLEACLAMLAWDDAEKNAKPFDADGGAGFYQRIDMCQDAFDKARAAIAKATDAPSRKGADTDRHGSDEQERESA